MRFKSYIKKLIFPDMCFICGEVLPFFSEFPYICKKCSFEKDVIPMDICEKCKRPRDIKPDFPVCPYCNGEKFKFDTFISPFYYRKGIKSAVHLYKFKKHYSSAKTIAYYLYLRVKHLENFTPEVIVPAPSSKKRLNKRGFNHTLLIAKYLSEYINIPYDDILIKIKHTPPQSTLPLKNRLTNLKDTFIVKDHNYKSVFLIDDVSTTGSTINELSAVLKKSGVKKIYAGTFAKTYNKGEDSH